MGRIKIICYALLICLLPACNHHPEAIRLFSDEQKGEEAVVNLINAESQRKETRDSIFYGIYFKMTGQQFYTQCNQMFKKGIFKGGYNYQIEVHLNQYFSRPVTLKFYPDFEKPVISKMLCSFSYLNGSIYKKADRSDVLIKELIPLLAAWYKGNDFIGMPSQNPLKGPQYIKVDANRKITVNESDNATDVDVIFEDLKAIQ